MQIFVYGTLKFGRRNHYFYCLDAVKIETGFVQGKLYLLPAGFPALKVNEDSILAIGTKDLQADFIVQKEAKTLKQSGEEWIQGEIITLKTPEGIRGVDRLESFNPGGASMYRRVLVTAKKGRKKVLFGHIPCLIPRAYGLKVFNKRI